VTTCIYYELDAVSPHDAHRARNLAGADVREIAPADAAWDDGIGGESPQREPHSRSPRLFDEWLPRIVRWTEALEQAVPAAARRHDVSLSELARYELLFGLAPALQRWHALADMRRRWNPDRLLWVTSRPDRELAELCRAVSPFPVEVHATAADRPSPYAAAWRTLKRRLGPTVQRARRLARSAVGSRPSPDGPVDLVCTEYFPNNVAASLSVAEKLQADYGLRVRWIAARPKVAAALAARGVDSLVLDDLLSPGAHLRSRIGTAQRRATRAALAELPRELFHQTGLPGEREYLLAVLATRLLPAWDQAASWIEAYDEVFAALRPAAVMSTTYSSPVGRASARAAQRYGGRAIYLQHGLLPRCSSYCSFCHDVLLMWGPNDYRNLTDFGVDPQMIRVTGSTIYDALARRRAPRPAATRLAVDRKLEVAFMASRTGGTMVSHGQARMCLVAAANALSRIPNAHLTVKIHPGDNTGMVPDVMRAFPQFAVVRSGNSQDVIVHSDLVIVVSSTTGLEACVADKPLIVLDVFGDPDVVPYAGYGAALSIPVARGDLAGELERAISRLRDDASVAAALAEGRQRLLDDMLHGARGDAVEQAAAAVAALLGRGEPQGVAQESAS
jgi:hypothetical protein